MLHLDYRDGQPIYRQIMEGLQSQIRSGILEPDHRLPSVRELAAQLAINPNTIQRAYRELETMGWIVSVPGKGSFVSAGGGALERRRAELREKFLAAAAELRAVGVSEAELQTMLKEGKKND